MLNHWATSPYSYFPEAGADAGVLDGQRLLVDPLVAVEGGDRLLGGGQTIDRSNVALI